jgi:uncharacterized protein (TIGR03435 family)
MDLLVPRYGGISQEADRAVITRRCEELRCLRKLLLAAAGAVEVVASLAFGVLCAPQLGAQSEPAALSFEVAAIKPDHLDGHSSRISYNSNSLVTSGVTLKRLIEFAYNVDDFQLSGGPAWADSETYQIQAKIDQETVAALNKFSGQQSSEQRRLMLQLLLAERFQLKLSHSTKELPIYALVLTKDGPKFSLSTASGSGQTGLSTHNGDVTAKGIAMTRFAEWLSQVAGRKVVDKTGLQGTYDFKLNYDNRRQALAAADAGQSPAPLPDSSGPSIFSALQDQLGLKLESQKGPVETLVIDSVERPSPN